MRPTFTLSLSLTKYQIRQLSPADLVVLLLLFLPSRKENKLKTQKPKHKYANEQSAEMIKTHAPVNPRTAYAK